MFTYAKTKSNVRIGEIALPCGKIQTPAFFPDATYGAVKILSFDDIKSAGINQLLFTTLHLYLKPGDRFIKRMGGLHNFVGWDGPILTDSGGWQVFSLIHQSGKGKVTKKGAEFVMEDGDTHLLTPEKSIEIQANLRSNILVVLDDPILGSGTYEENLKAMELTVMWASRAKKAFLKRFQLDETKFNNPQKYKRPLLFAVVQGGDFLDLRKRCASELAQIGFDGYGFGGILIKENKRKKFELLEQFCKVVPEDKIRYGMGVGRIEDIKFCIEHGFDIFDSVVPTRNGRHGNCYTRYGTVNLKSSKCKYDKRPISSNCECMVCSNKQGFIYSRSYLHHLFKVNEMGVMRLCSIHNLTFYNKLITDYRAKANG